MRAVAIVTVCVVIGTDSFVAELTNGPSLVAFIGSVGFCEEGCGFSLCPSLGATVLDQLPRVVVVVRGQGVDEGLDP